ncbi:MAG: hypothetical protein GTO02_19040, partial [Candidatus Dadabacteria bacterium]|nr:hypothetical protein [Candidatus Dadabacteria bacterium]
MNQEKYFHTINDQGPLIRFPNRLIIEDGRYPVGIQFSDQFATTPGRVFQSSNSLQEGLSLHSNNAHPLVSDVLPSRYRGTFYEESRFPYPDTSLPTVMPGNFELDLLQQTHYDGSYMSPGLAEQIAVQKRIAIEQFRFDREFQMRKNAIDEAKRIATQLSKEHRLDAFFKRQQEERLKEVFNIIPRVERDNIITGLRNAESAIQEIDKAMKLLERRLVIKQDDAIVASEIRDQIHQLDLDRERFEIQRNNFRTALDVGIPI